MNFKVEKDEAAVYLSVLKKRENSKTWLPCIPFKEESKEFRTEIVSELLDIARDILVPSEISFQAVNLYDRFACKITVPRNNALEYAVAALRVVIKFNAGLKCHITYLKKSIIKRVGTSDSKRFWENSIKLEFEILEETNHILLIATPFDFLREYVEKFKEKVDVARLSRFYCALALLDADVYDCSPSLLAAASIATARSTLTQSFSFWDAPRALYFGYGVPDLFILSNKLQEMKKHPKSGVVRRRYEDLLPSHVMTHHAQSSDDMVIEMH